jgi:hypothetical protein
VFHGPDGTAEFNASVIAMVASDGGAFLTGTEIRLDGDAHA